MLLTERGHNPHQFTHFGKHRWNTTGIPLSMLFDIHLFSSLLCNAYFQKYPPFSKNLDSNEAIKENSRKNLKCRNSKQKKLQS